MEEASETMIEDVPEPMEEATSVVEEAMEEQTVADEGVEVEAPSPTMQRPTALLKPIRGTLRPLEEEEEVRTAPLTPVGHMLIPEKKRGPPPSSSMGQKTATLKPVRGTLTPVSKTPVKRLEPSDDQDEN